jgi:hypothetical protein
VPSGVRSSKVQWLLRVSRSRPEAVTYVRKIVSPARTKTVTAHEELVTALEEVQQPDLPLRPSERVVLDDLYHRQAPTFDD